MNLSNYEFKFRLVFQNFVTISRLRWETELPIKCVIMKRVRAKKKRRTWSDRYHKPWVKGDKSSLQNNYTFFFIGNSVA